jgi:hypothetical protein
MEPTGHLAESPASQAQAVGNESELIIPARVEKELGPLKRNQYRSAQVRASCSRCWPSLYIYRGIGMIVMTSPIENMLTPFSLLPDGKGEYGPCPEVLTEDELIRFLRIPEVSKAGDYRHVIENLKRFHGLPSIHIGRQPLPTEAK